VRARRGAPGVPRAPFAAPRATMRTREGAMLTPRDAPPIGWDALPIPEDALRVRRASTGKLGDAPPGVDHAAAEPRACRPVLRASQRACSRPLGTPRGASRAPSGAVRLRSHYFTRRATIGPSRSRPPSTRKSPTRPLAPGSTRLPWGRDARPWGAAARSRSSSAFR
jgi:hypothetical protein